MSLGGSHKEWRKREPIRELEIIYDMKRLKYMNCIHDNKINNISEWNLLHDIPNPLKHTRNINSHYFTIMCGCMNMRRGGEKYKTFWILFDSGFSYSVVTRRLTTKHKTKKDDLVKWHTHAGNITTNLKVK